MSKSINSFRNWSTARKMRALSLMDDYVRNHAPSYGADHWRKNCPLGKSLEETESIRANIANNDELFTNALWAFYIALTTNLDWLKL